MSVANQRSPETVANSDGWHNGQRFKWVNVPEPAGGKGEGHPLIWGVFATAFFVLGFAAVTAVRRANQELNGTCANLNRAENVMAEDPSMVDFLNALKGNSPKSRINARSHAGCSSPNQASETAEPAGAEPLAVEATNLASLWADFLKANRSTGAKEDGKTLAQLIEIAERIKEHPEASKMPSPRLLACGLHGLLKQFLAKTANITPSSLRTAASAIDLLELLCKRAGLPDLLNESPLSFLVVDDDAISRSALSSALRKVFTEPELAPDGKTALILASRQAYDVIFLDVEMPGLDGFEVCSKIHHTAKNCTTPVIFVTSHNDFDSRAKSALAGAHELIGKPFLVFEITVKALTLVIKARLAKQEEQQAGNQINMPESGSASDSNGQRKVSDEPSATGVLPSTSTADRTNYPPSRVNPVPLAVPSRAVINAKPVQLTVAESHQLPPTNAESSKTFFKSASALMDLARKQLNAAFEIDTPAARNKLLDELLRTVQTISAGAGRAQLTALVRISSALEALVKRLGKFPCYRTATMGLDAIEKLCQSRKDLDLVQTSIRLLVVDDDPVARRTVGGSLQLAFSRPDEADSGEAALILAASKPYDLIIVDVVMPGMDGFVTCQELLKLPMNSLAPVVFVTSQDDALTRAQASESGGCDFIPKPVLPSEIVLLALSHIVQARLARPFSKPQNETSLSRVPAMV